MAIRECPLSDRRPTTNEEITATRIMLLTCQFSVDFVASALGRSRSTILRRKRQFAGIPHDFKALRTRAAS